MFIESEPVIFISVLSKCVVKTGVKHGIAAQSLSVSGDDKVAVYNWNISPIIVDTTNLWNKGAGGATLNLPQNVKDLIGNHYDYYQQYQ